MGALTRHFVGLGCCLFIAALKLNGIDLNLEREWTSADGRAIIATVQHIDAKAKNVQMRRADGVNFTIPWNRLSAEDIALIKASLNTEKADTNTEIPDEFELRKVPMVKQKGNFCVPASATMIAGFHGIETDQDQVAKLSSEASETNQGTYPSDMILAMEKLGFDGQVMNWKDDTFHNKALPNIRRALIETGPIYISFRPGVFGEMGHGCVIIGYNNRREELTFHNPWGTVFKKTYSEVATQGYGVVFIDPPKAAPIASEAFIQQMEQTLPKFNGNFLVVAQRLIQNKQPHELVWCSRRDARDDRRFAKDTARRDGRKILELAFERNPAVLIPYSPDGITEKYFFVTRPPEGGASFMVREITDKGWSQPELQTLGSLTREWTTLLTSKDSTESVWELPMIELQETQ